jgi:hypothetical protein
MQGKVTITGGDGKITLDNPAIEAGQLATITAFNITGPNLT